MRQKFDTFMNHDVKIGKFTFTTLQIVFIFCILLISALIRFSLRHIVSGDMDGALYEWLTITKENGGFHSLPLNFSCYNCPYMYILCFISYLDDTFSYVYYIKLVSILFDYLAAIIMFFIIYEISRDIKKSIWGFAAVLLAPTIFLNSAAWGQCDMFFAVFLLFSYYYLLRQKRITSMIFFGLSFSIKLQAVFFFPFLIIMWLCKKIRLVDFLMIPMVFILTSVPAMLFGKSFSDILAVYLGQPDFYSELTLNYPNMYIFLDSNKHTSPLGDTGIFLAIALLGCLMFYIYSQKCEMTQSIMITLVLFSVSIVVYCLPHMHERYGFILDVFAIIYGLTARNPHRVLVALAFQAVSLLAYIPYLFRSDTFSLLPIAIFFTCLIYYIGKELYQQIQVNRSKY